MPSWVFLPVSSLAEPLLGHGRLYEPSRYVICGEPASREQGCHTARVGCDSGPLVSFWSCQSAPRWGQLAVRPSHLRSQRARARERFLMAFRCHPRCLESSPMRTCIACSYLSSDLKQSWPPSNETRLGTHKKKGNCREIESVMTGNKDKVPKYIDSRVTSTIRARDGRSLILRPPFSSGKLPCLR